MVVFACFFFARREVARALRRRTGRVRCAVKSPCRRSSPHVISTPYAQLPASDTADTVRAAPRTMHIHTGESMDRRGDPSSSQNTRSTRPSHAVRSPSARSRHRPEDAARAPRATQWKSAPREMTPAVMAAGGCAPPGELRKVRRCWAALRATTRTLHVFSPRRTLFRPPQRQTRKASRTARGPQGRPCAVVSEVRLPFLEVERMKFGRGVSCMYLVYSCFPAGLES